MSKELIPFNDRVIVRPIEEEEQMYGSIVVPDMGKERPEMGEVIAVGPGRMSDYGQFIRVNAKVGDIILIPKLQSIRVEFDNQEYFVTRDREILAVIKNIKDE